MYTTGRFIINGKIVDPPIEAVPSVGSNGLFIEAAFGVDNVQPAITPLDFTFPNETAKLIRDYVADGNIFQNMDFEAEVIGEAGTFNVVTQNTTDMIMYSSFSVINKAAGDTLKITWTVTFG